jgi:Flp pilus assembly protein TadD
MPGDLKPANATMTIRSAVFSTTLGALVAAPALYLAIETAPQGPPATQLGPNYATDSNAIGIEAWPICSTMGAIASNADWAPLDPDFAAGKKALAAEDWLAAIKALASAALRDTRNADIQNYLGYAYRRLRQFEPAFRHYQQAVTLNPRHRSAHEHLGEAYLVQGDLAKAEEHLATLERICLIPCEEYDDLKRAIAAYNKVVRR